MVCRAGNNYFGNDVPAETTNWSGDVAFHPATWKQPMHNIGIRLPGMPDPSDGLASLVEAVATAGEKGQSIHAIGNGWSFEDCASSDGMMISLENLNRQLFDVVNANNGALTDESAAKQDVWSSTRLVHFEAGIRIWDLCSQLDQQQLAMPTLGGSNGQSLAGALTTSTHGGDWQQPPLVDVVRAVHLVTVDGVEWWIESSTMPLTKSDNNNAALIAQLPCKNLIVVRDDAIFNAVRVAMGRFGVIYSLVLEVRKQFLVAEVVTTPSASDVLTALRAGQGTASVFTPLFRLLASTPPPPGMEDAVGVPYFLQVLFNSQRASDVWVTRRWEVSKYWETTGNAKQLTDFTLKGTDYQALGKTIVNTVNAALLEVLGAGGVDAGILTGVLTGLLGPVGTTIAATVGAVAATAAAPILEMVAELDALVATGNPDFGSVLAAALTAVWSVPGLGLLIPQINGMVLQGDLVKTMKDPNGMEVRGRRGPDYLVCTGAKEDSDQSAYKADSIEVVFDAMTADYLNFLDEILPIAPLFPQAGYVSLRPSLRGTATLSMHNVMGIRAISIEIASLKNLPGNAAWMSFVHQSAVRHNGRPHWGQYNKLDALTVSVLYGDLLNQWREALHRVSGASTQFSNAYTRQRGLEPEDIVRIVTAVRKSGHKITHLCHAGETWSPIAVSQVIQDIQAGTAKYFATSGRTSALIKVVSDGHGGHVLRTAPDATSADNLDNLPLC